MATTVHQDPIVREETISRYISRKLPQPAAEQFEEHYLECQDCFEEVRAAEMLIFGLRQNDVESIRNNDVTVIRFNSAAELTGASPVLLALSEIVESQGDKRVLIDLSGVSRIDSAGLGALMSYYTHAVRNSGILKLLNPNSQVKKVLSMTHIDSVVPTFEDEAAALASFQ
jgi:anti-sigma B factor antagonist